MGLLSGAASVTRFTVLACPEEPDFEEYAFREIPPGGEVRDRAGFVPFEPGAAYRIGHKRFAFRVRMDALRPDPTAVKERFKELIKAEKESTGAAAIGGRKRKQLRELAVAEALERATPRARLTECLLDDKVLYVGSTASTALSTAMALAQAAGIELLWKTPWIDRGEEDVESELFVPRGPGQAVLGCRFLKALIGDDDVALEPEKGKVALVTPEARVALAGAVTPDLGRFLKRECELLSARLLWNELAFRFDAPGFRVAALHLETERFETFEENLDARMERIVALYELLDAKYEALAPKLRGQA
ncbi:MAG: hypothetical protein EPN53_06970 [Acidobacteria bacterium]|nr:MAG: hypothetical protein EPN53_06970 [Acidobacteriota bacterium]